MGLWSSNGRPIANSVLVEKESRLHLSGNDAVSRGP